jgi:hypothetical protein
MKQELYRLETTLPLAGKTETHTLKQWQRIYGYDRDTLAFNNAHLVKVEPVTEQAR